MRVDEAEVEPDHLGVQKRSSARESDSAPTSSSAIRNPTDRVRSTELCRGKSSCGRQVRGQSFGEATASRPLPLDERDSGCRVLLRTGEACSLDALYDGGRERGTGAVLIKRPSAYVSAAAWTCAKWLVISHRVGTSVRNSPSGGSFPGDRCIYPGPLTESLRWSSARKTRSPATCFARARRGQLHGPAPSDGGVCAAAGVPNFCKEHPQGRVRPLSPRGRALRAARRSSTS